MAAKIPGIGQLANLVGKEVAKGMLKLGGKTAEKVTPRAGVSVPKPPRPFTKKVYPDKATITKTSGKKTTVKSPEKIAATKPEWTKAQADAETMKQANIRAKKLAANSKVIGNRRIKDIAGTSGVAGTTAYLAGKKNKKKY